MWKTLVITVKPKQSLTNKKDLQKTIDRIKSTPMKPKPILVKAALKSKKS
jgi:hypothetical protein